MTRRKSSPVPPPPAPAPAAAARSGPSLYDKASRSFWNYLFAWLPAFNKRSSSPENRVRFVRSLAFFLGVLSSFVVFLDRSWLGLFVGIGVGLAGLWTLFVLIDQLSRFRRIRPSFRQAAMPLASLILIWTGLFTVLTLLGLTSVVYPPISWLFVLIAHLALLQQRIWMVEIARGQVYIYLPHEQPLNHFEIVGYPQPQFSPEVKANLKRAGLYERTTDYILYDMPDYLWEPLEGQWAGVFARVRGEGEQPPDPAVEQALRGLAAAYLAGYSPAEPLPDHYTLLSAIIQVENAERAEPIFWIEPGGDYHLLWNQIDPIFVEFTLDRSDGLMFKVKISFMVLADPERITAPGIRQQLARAAQDAHASGDPALLPNRLRGLISGAFSSTARQSAAPVLRGKHYNQVVQDGTLDRLKAALAGDYFKGLEGSMGASVQGWSIFISPEAPEGGAAGGNQAAQISANLSLLDDYGRLLRSYGWPDAQVNYILTQLLLEQATARKARTRGGRAGGLPLGGITMPPPQALSGAAPQSQLGPAPTTQQPAPDPKKGQIEIERDERRSSGFGLPGRKRNDDKDDKDDGEKRRRGRF